MIERNPILPKKIRKTLMGLACAISSGDSEAIDSALQETEHQFTLMWGLLVWHQQKFDLIRRRVKRLKQKTKTQEIGADLMEILKR
ncbi:MAG TPA: hypothetical protein DD761_20160 [Cyanobacteria bacterium UBA11691]|nr:hypothetical protein [Cyanobacteria bacterium UBA11691]